MPPTGAKGLNLAATDVKLLSRALIEHYRERSDAGLDTYSERCLRRVWRAERFSWWFTSLMHHFPEDGAIGARLQDAELDYLFHSEHAARTAGRELRRPTARLRRAASGVRVIIDIHGHYTTAPKALEMWRNRQIAASRSLGQPPVRVSASRTTSFARRSRPTSCAR